MGGRSKVARTRLTPEEYDVAIAAPARAAGISEGEYMRNALLAYRSFEPRLTSIEDRLLNLERQFSDKWVQEAPHGTQTR